MKFKGLYRNEDSDISLGKFFNSDIRKLIALRQYYPLMFSDEIGDPYHYYTDRVRAENSLYIAVRQRAKVFAYGALEHMTDRACIMQYWHKRGVRVRKTDALEGARLILKFAFEVFSMTRVGTTIAMDDRIKEGRTFRRLAESIGFKVEGTVRKVVVYDGIPTDLRLYGILKEEFKWQ